MNNQYFEIMRGVLIVAFFFLYQLSAVAQYEGSASASLGMGHGYTALSQSVMSNAFKNSGKSINKAANADYLYLGFSHFRGFEELLFNKVLAANGNIDKGKLRSFLTGTRTMYHFDSRAQALGLKSNYLSDILAIGMAWNWEMYHQVPAEKGKVISLRNSIRSNMAKNEVQSKLKKMSEEDRRNWILSFMYNNSMLAQQIKQSGKTSALHKEQLIKTAALAGVPDIAKVSLR